MDSNYVEQRLAGHGARGESARRRWIDYVIALAATAVFVAFALVAEAPKLELDLGAALLVVIATLALLGAAAAMLWRTTRFT